MSKEIRVTLHTVNGNVVTAFPAHINNQFAAALNLIREYLAAGKQFTVDGNDQVWEAV